MHPLAKAIISCANSYNERQAEHAVDRHQLNLLGWSVGKLLGDFADEP